MGAAHVPVDMRYKVAVEAVRCATQLDGLIVTTVGGKTCMSDEHVYGEVPKWASKLRTFGEAGVVKEGKDGKTGDRGQDMIFVGYAIDRGSDCVRMYNPVTNCVVQTRDVIWLKRMYYEKPKQAPNLEVSNNEAKDGDGQTESDPDEATASKGDVPVAGGDDVNDADDVATTVTSNTTTRFGQEVRPPDQLIETMQV